LVGKGTLSLSHPFKGKVAFSQSIFFEGEGGLSGLFEGEVAILKKNSEPFL
jgi:hypothetical protein